MPHLIIKHWSFWLMMDENRKKKPRSVWTILKNYFLKIWKITMETLYIHKKNCFKNKIILSKFQLQKFHENSPCFKSYFICLKHLRKTCGQVVLSYQKSFSLIKYSPNHFNFFCENLIYFTKGSMCSKHSKNKNTYIVLDFNTRMSFYTIIVLNM